LHQDNIPENLGCYTIIHQEDLIVESDTLIIQRNTIIEFLQEQVHDLALELDDAIAHINVLQE
jgi:hypothetical protein